MAILEILTFPDPFLRKTTQRVVDITDEIHDIIENMAATMYDAPGSGLAAIQVGIDKSIIIYDIAPRDETRSLQVLINPMVVNRSGELISENEGCLSVPEYRADVKRAAAVLVKALDREGNPVTIEAESFHATVLQHEIDHLNGILFIDHLSPLKREIYKRRVKKQQRSK